MSFADWVAYEAERIVEDALRKGATLDRSTLIRVAHVCLVEGSQRGCSVLIMAAQRQMMPVAKAEERKSKRRKVG